MVSNGAKEVATALGVERVYEDREFRNNFNHTIINWGNPRAPAWSKPNTKWLNHPDCVAVAINKLSTFQKWSTSPSLAGCFPEFTTDATVAREWASQTALVGRLTLVGSGGQGIVLTSPQDPPEGFRTQGVKLWTKYVKKRKEFRVHVFNNQVIHTQEKRRRVDSQINSQIRNLEGGWVFCVEGIEADHRRDAIAIAAVQALGLTFGSIDLVWNERANAYYCLECNTASGVEGSTVAKYVSAIKSNVRY